MRLHVRLALPLLSVVFVATGAGIAGTVWLVRRTLSSALDQEARQFERISENALAERSRELNDAAAVLAFIDGPTGARLKVWGKTRMDAAAVVDRRTGRVRSLSGTEPDLSLIHI